MDNRESRTNSNQRNRTSDNRRISENGRASRNGRTSERERSARNSQTSEDTRNRTEGQPRNNRRNAKKIQQKFLRLTGVLLCFSVIMLIAGLMLGHKFGEKAGTNAAKVELESLQGQLDTVKSEKEAIVATDAEQDAWEEEKENAWYLRLVNQSNPIGEEEEIDLAEIDGFYVDSRMMTDLEAMLQAGTEAGTGIYIRSAYREWDTQALYFSNMLEMYSKSEPTYYDAYIKASNGVAVPGESEHQLGLAVDLISSEYETLDEGQADTEVARWLEAHAAEYGFILRYPKDKEDITGIMYEPWHYRYVGVDAATEIMAQGITLEEYLEK